MSKCANMSDARRRRRRRRRGEEGEQEEEKKEKLVMYACVLFIRVCIKCCMCMLALKRSMFLFGELAFGIQQLVTRMVVTMGHVEPFKVQTDNWSLYTE